MAGHPQENSWQQDSQGEPDYGPVYEQPGIYDQRSDAYEQPSGQEETLYDHPVSYEQPGYSERERYGQRERYGRQGQYDRQGRYEQQGQGRYDQYGKGRSRAGWEKLQHLSQQKAGKSASGSAGFVSSLFDFGFTSFVTPKIIKAIYALVTVWTLLWAVFFLFVGNNYGHIWGVLIALIIVDPIFVLVSLGIVRVVLEFFMVTFRMQEDLKGLREQGSDTVAKPGGGEDSGDSPRAGV